ncbi:DUF2975 domain-containing protein [Catenulispora pinisilvae]|uniref:DUF2975 domain-containing protein n=1 Tax=Catenulispora pinisilvae TaxID=2705253 RepID=UPI00189218CA|nr:DUF2975 domain-containing protein [Catenulispora pinisilvae]
MTRKQRDPLQPLLTVVDFIFSGLVVVTVLGAGLAVFSRGVSIFGWSRTVPYSVCVPTDDSNFRATGITVEPGGLRPGTGASMQSASICLLHPTTGQAVALTIAQVTGFVLFAGAFYLVRRLLRDAAKNGLFTPDLARWLRALGWWLLAGEVIATIVVAAIRISLLNRMVNDRIGPGLWYGYLHGSWTVIFFGVGLITAARIMRVGSVMREDLEGTV